MNTDGVVLLNNAGAGNGAVVNILGGKYALLAEATFGGGNIKLQIQLSQGGFADVGSSTLSAAGMVVLDLPPGSYRAVVTTSTAAHARLARIPS